MRLLLALLIFLINMPSCDSPDVRDGFNSVAPEPTSPEPPQQPQPPPSPPPSPAVSSIFIYRLDTDAAKIYRASVDPASGEITEHGATDIIGGNQPVSMAVSPDQKYLFVGSSQPPKIHTYAIDQTTGQLTFAAVLTSLFDQLDKIYADPQGQYLWTLERYTGVTFIATYSVDQSGSLSYKTDNSISGGDIGIDLATDINSKRLYVALQTQGLTVFEINQNGRAVNQGTTYGSEPNTLVVNSATTRVYASPKNYGDKIPYLILDPATGDVVSSDYLRNSGQTNPFNDIALNAQGDRLYLLGDSVVRSYTFKMSPNEDIEPLNAVSLPTGCNAKAVSLHAEGGYLFTGCTDSSGKTFSLRIYSDGSVVLEDTSENTGMKVNDIVSVAF